MLTKLTKEQEELIPQVRDEWIARFLSLEFDEKKAEKLIDYCYLKINKNVIKIFVDSPMAVQYACSILSSDQVRDQVWEKVRDQVWEKVRDQVRDQVWEKVRDQVGSQVRDQVWEKVRDQVWVQVRVQVRVQVGSQVWDQVGRQVGRQVREKVREKVWEKVRENVGRQVDSRVWGKVGRQVREKVSRQVWENAGRQVGEKVSAVRSHAKAKQKINYLDYSYYGDVSDFGWVSFYDFFSRIGILKNKEFEQYKESVKANIFLWVALKNYAVVSRPPVFLRGDEQNRMHCTTDYAIAFKDGYGQHYVHGVFFEPELFGKFFREKDFSGKDILALKNAEQKAAILQEYGFDKVIKDTNARVIDVYHGKSQITKKPVQYELIDFEIDELQCRAVKVEDHTTHKIVTLGVPRRKETEDCLGALAWTFNMKKEEYKLKIES